MPHPLCYNLLMKMKNKKTFKFTIAPSKANNLAGWTSTVQAHTMISAVAKLKERKHDVKKIEEISE